MTNDTVIITHEIEPQDISVRIYSVDCGCGAALGYRVTADRDNDVHVRVDPHICEQEEE